MRQAIFHAIQIAEFILLLFFAIWQFRKRRIKGPMLLVLIAGLVLSLVGIIFDQIGI